jgi:hypothetical protein
MATESAKEAGQDPMEAFTDDLIREFFTEAGQSSKSGRRGRSGMGALLEAVMSADGSSATSLLERLLIAQTIASELAQAIAPALAESLTPEIMKAMELYAPDGQSRKEPTATRARRTGAK